MERKIFAYNDGESQVYGDPTEIDFDLVRLGVEELIFSRRLLDLPQSEDGKIDLGSIEGPDAKLLIDAYHDAEPLIRQVFRVKPFDRQTGRGLLFQDVIELLGAYYDWRDSVKKNSERPRVYAKPTG